MRENKSVKVLRTPHLSIENNIAKKKKKKHSNKDTVQITVAAPDQ